MTPLSPAQSLTVDRLKILLIQTLDDNKASEIEVIDLKGLSTLADYMVIASGTSSRQVSALASKIRDLYESLKLPTPRSEGESQGDWVVVDCNDIIVHIFRPEVREFYNIEKMWRPHGLSGPPRSVTSSQSHA